MSVRVRMFAALREAAGEDTVEVSPAPLSRILDELRDAYGPVFAERLEVCTVLVDGTAVRRQEHRDIPDGVEIALLPPVSGGSRLTFDTTGAP